MNGRVYDPVLGRFLSADPHVDDPDDSQAFNRYSYVCNNPLGYTDPSGYFKLGDALKIVGAIVVGYFTAGLATPLLSGAFASLGTTLGMSASFAASWGAAVAGGVGFGFGSSFAGSLLNGGSIGDAFKAGVIGGIRGGITAGLTSGIGHKFFGDEIGSFANEAGRAVTHGLIQGGLEEAFGGDFRNGFIGGVIGSAIGSGLKYYGVESKLISTIVAAVAGGTAAELGGGKFANGAFTAAFTNMFNHYGNDVFDAGSGVAMGILEGFTVSYNADISTGNENMDMGRSVGRWIGRIAGLAGMAKGAIVAGRQLGSRLFVAGGLRAAAPTAAEIALNPKIYAQLEKQLATSGVDSIRKGLLRAEQTLAQHEANAIKYGNQGGYISQVNRTIENVASQIKTMKQFLADKGL